MTMKPLRFAVSHGFIFDAFDFISMNQSMNIPITAIVPVWTPSVTS